MSDRLRLVCCILLLLGYACASVTNANELTIRMQTGTTRLVNLVDIQADRVTVAEVRVSEKKAERSEILFDQLLSIGQPSDQPEFDQVIFRNGSVLVAVVKSVGQDQIQIESRVWQNEFVPTRLVKGIIFQPRATEVSRQVEIDAIVESANSQTQLTLENDDVILGTLAQKTAEQNTNAPKANTKSDAREQTNDDGVIFFKIGEKPSMVSIAKTRSITFADLVTEKRDPKRAAGFHELGFSDGSLLAFKSTEINRGTVSISLVQNFKLVAGAKVLGKPFWSRVCYFRPSLNSIRFLSDEKPFRVIDSKFELNWETKFDRSVMGGRLIVGNQKTTKGIGTHAESQVIFLLGKNDKSFRGSVGLDQSASKLGDAICRIVLLNSENRWIPHSNTFSVTAGSPAKEIKIDVSGYRAIGLVTQKGNHGTVGDRVNWMNARIISTK